MSVWPLDLPCTAGVLTLPGPGRYAFVVQDDGRELDLWVDGLLAAARARFYEGAVAWMPENGGLLSNLPAWENVLLSTQWHAPASLAALETRVRGWCAQLGYDTTALDRLLARSPAFLDEDQRLLAGWLRHLLSRPRLVVMRAAALPDDAFGKAMLALLAEELPGAALLVVDEYVPAGFQPVLPRVSGISEP